jgi:hypothetical protein
MGFGLEALPVNTINGPNLLEMSPGDGKVCSHTSSRFVFLPTQFFLLIPIADRNIHLQEQNRQPRPPWNFWTYLNSWYQSLSCQPTISALQKNLRLTQNMGCALNPDGNSGSVKGYSECSKTGRTGQPASVAYEVAQCKNVTILTYTLVHKILFDTSNT